MPASFLYASPAQAARYLAYHRAWSPSVTDARVRGLYDAAYEAAGDAGRWIGLGCGSGEKDARALARAPREEVLLCDASASLVLEAMGRVPGARGTVLDLEADVRFDGGPTVYGAFGLLPNLDLLDRLAGLIGPEDTLLLSANLGADRARIVPQYDNAEARAWYAGALRELGVDADVEVHVEDGEPWSIVVTAEPHQPLLVFDETIEVPRLEVFRSRRYEDLRRTLASKLRVVEAFETEEEGVYVLRP